MNSKVQNAISKLTNHKPQKCFVSSTATIFYSHKMTKCLWNDDVCISTEFFKMFLIVLFFSGGGLLESATAYIINKL